MALLQEEIEDELPKMQTNPGIPQVGAKNSFSGQSGRSVNVQEDRNASLGSKVTALKNYRRAKGLCFTCGEKWGPGHKCSTTVPLHVVEEFLAMLQPEDNDSGTSSPDREVFQDALADDQEVLMSISCDWD